MNQLVRLFDGKCDNCGWFRDLRKKWQSRFSASFFWDITGGSAYVANERGISAYAVGTRIVDVQFQSDARTIKIHKASARITCQEDPL